MSITAQSAQSAQSVDPAPYRLGFAVRTVGRPGLNGGAPADLSIALVHVGDVLTYLQQINVRFYRAAFTVAADFSAQIAACEAQLAMLAVTLARSNTRITLHLDHGVALGTPNDAQAAAALLQVEGAAHLLAALDSARPPGVFEGTLVVHVGGAGPGGRARFAQRYRALSANARRRLSVEHDGAGHSLGELLSLHQQCGVPIVFDQLHWELHNPEQLPLDLALGFALATWPAGMRAEVHLSSPRSEAHLLPGRKGATARVFPPRPGQHADFVDAAALIRLLTAARGLPPFDLMLEAKAGELALLRLREEIARRQGLRIRKRDASEDSQAV
jgi:UV DNA damage endonuclease